MSIKTRVEDAERLWATGRREGAWVLALIATAATAKKRYPTKGDKEGFKTFICDIARTIITGEVGGASPLHINFYTENRAETRTLEDIMYIELRCNLVHEAELKDVTFSESTSKDDRYEGTLNVPTKGRAVIPDFWVLNLIAAVKAAPENTDLFG
ncbi:MAG: hypothetical protein DMF90_27855 [Acidobacteria bacterium]|nr:MAG: hypothetical protein DMF90_27855 [Acidobacteriota bacterium]